MAAPPPTPADASLPTASPSAAAAAPALAPSANASSSSTAADRSRRDASETSELSSLDGEAAAADDGRAPAALAPASADGETFRLASASRAASSVDDGQAGAAGAILPAGGAPAAEEVAASTNGGGSASELAPSPPTSAAAKMAIPPAPRSLSSALSSPGSPAASNSSDPTAETEPLAGSPRPDDLDDDDDASEADADASGEDDDEEAFEPPSAPHSPSKRARPAASTAAAAAAAGGAAPRAPSAPPPAKGANGKVSASPVTVLPVRAATASPKTALQLKQDGLHALGIWKADEEGDSDLTPDEESDADDTAPNGGQDDDDDDDDDDRMDVDPSPTKKTPAGAGKRASGQDTTPQPSTRASTTTAGRDDDDDAAASSAAEDHEVDSRPKRSTRVRRSPRKAPVSDDDEAESESSDDDAQRTPNGTSGKKANAAAGPAVSPSSALKSAPRTVNGELPSAREKSPVVPQSEELSPPPTSPAASNAADDDEDDDDDAAAEDDDGKTPTKAKPDVRFNLMTAGTTADAGGLFQADEEMEDDDDDEASEDEAPTGGINGEVPELRIEEAPDVNAAGEEVDPEAAGAEADEAVLPDTPVLGGPENESNFPVALNLQAQQRLDAMEALSKIEIAFARLRDLMHLERMEECAREEEKLLNDTHPLLMQVQTRLTALRDRELTSIEARHVVATKESALVERADVRGIWEWWRNGREELQRDMMADVMRKRRRVDREKRAVEGGRPKRPLPVPLPGPQRASRKDPTLEDLLPNSYLNYRPDEKKKMREEREAWGPRPGLVGLDERGRDNDLDMLGIGPSTRHQPHQPQLFRPFDGHGPPMMGGPPMHPHHHVLQNQPPQPYHTLHPHAYPPPPPPPHPADGVYLQNRAQFPYRPPILAPYQAEPHQMQGHPPPMGMHPQHPQHAGGPPPPHMAGLQPPFADAYGKPPASVVVPRPPPGSGGHHATGRAIVPSSSLPGVGPSGPEVGHASYATFDMAFGGGGGAGAGAGGPPPVEYGHPPPNGQPGGLEATGSPLKRARTGSPVGFRTLGVV